MDGLSKSKQKYIQSLHNKKYRKELGRFLVEGQKSISELIDSNFEIEELVLTETAAKTLKSGFKCTIENATIIDKLSFFSSNNFGIAIVKIPEAKALPKLENQWILALDGIKDPGNLGTLVRLSDWYGIKDIICSEDTVELFNPKVISSTMGSFTRVNCHYTDLEEYLRKQSCTVIGAFMDGENLHTFDFTDKGILIIGSEYHGISPNIESLCNNKITIPSFGGSAESLNAAMAGGIILDNLRRSLK